MLFKASALNAAAQTPVKGLGARRISAGAVAAAAAAAVVTVTGPNALRLQVPFGLTRPTARCQAAKKKPRLSWLFVDALSGAVGEIASLACLYPLDTLKVRCQAQGASAGVVLEELRAMGCSMRTVRVLYAGMGSAALCSAAIGAFYLLAFYTVKRVGGEFAARQRAAAAGAASGSASPSARRSAGVAAASGSQLADGTTQRPPLNVEGTHPLVASLAGVTASIVASVFEAPMETYKLRAQAGALGGGSMLGSMFGTAARQGLGALYLSFGAFMIKSIPYDFAELVTYSQMCDLREGAAARRAAAGQQQQLQQRRRPGDAGAGAGGAPAATTAAAAAAASNSSWQEQLGDLMARSPSGVGDMIIGAAAGAAAVLASMPCDVVKTHMDLRNLHYPCPAGANPLLHSTSQFLAAGRSLMAQGGLGALFVGVTPRLLQTMPSTMVYWFAVEGTRRALMQYVDVGEEQQAVAAPAIAAPAPAPALQPAMA